ncbi:hypothetical protein NUW58_g1590 [Xylaria curta]|uniref:Uncharacterized protein n=1 Tax=Xylaria curta TaxID=42375 RepID=A0ACC1PL46_9PEZI|nr:hypothetical protein NUW58_g1590 [Xylaria curta]
MAPTPCKVRHARREGICLVFFIRGAIATGTTWQPLTPCVDSDIPFILLMIRELADYEHELDAVEATEASLGATIAFAPDNVESVSTAPNVEPATPTRPARCLILFDECPRTKVVFPWPRALQAVKP